MGGIGASDLAGANDVRDDPRARGGTESAAAPPGPAPAPAFSPETRRRLRALSLEAEKRWFAGRWMEAIPVVAEIIRLDPLNARAHRDLGVTYLCCGRCGEAAASLRRAVELQPADEDALGYLVEALERQGREAEALEVCHALRRSAQDEADRGFYAVKALMKEGRSGEAERDLQTLATLAPRRANTVHRIGKLLSDLGRFEAAERLLARGVEETPTAFPALADIKRMTEEDRPLLRRMEAALDRPTLPALARLAIHFGLGKAYDDLGEHARAIGHYDAGNSLRARSIRFNRQDCAARVDRTLQSFTAEALDRAAPLLARPARPEDDLPVLVVGMPRSGTTLVEQILSSHPTVAPGGELPFWADRLATWQAAGVIPIRRDSMAEVAEAYLSLLRGLGPKALRVTDKMPRNFELLWLVRLALPQARIIHCRRHPIDTCLSNYFTNFWAGHEYAWERGDLVFYYRQYERLMDHWRRILPPDRFIEVDYEALVVDREAQTRRLVAFLGLDWNDACLAPERNPRVVRTASRWQARQPVYATSMQRWRRYEPWLGALRALAPVEMH
ncbi:transcriptional activator [Roseiarcus fermentans]|uniref:Transcriptional activator n=1 Tax=Roseiarcus fermentans TaxID=1473586 RepID=A0A366FLN1_9HYPH|nr:sulfotransferase [Roseiarcus fermentans]RBP15594.1 transcriptional activator [Roseiarcus fermentans]